MDLSIRVGHILRKKDRHQEKNARFQSIGPDLSQFHQKFRGHFGSLLESLNI